jgi:hypothetical protein
MGMTVYVVCRACGRDLTGSLDQKYCGPACQRLEHRKRAIGDNPELAFLSCFVLAAVAVSQAESIVLNHPPRNISSALMSTRRS